MFDSTNIKILNSRADTTISNYNSVSGTIVKSTRGSKIIRFNMKSDRATTFFDVEEPHYIKTKQSKGEPPYYSTSDINTKIPIEVLQVMLCGGDNYLVEYIEIKET